MAADGSVTFEIKADASQAKTAINNVVKSMKSAGSDVETSFTKSADKAFGGLVDSAKNAAAGIAAAFSAAAIGKAVANFASEAIKAASSLEEVQNVVDVTFGGAADKINDWAKQAGKQFGLTETQAKQFTSTLGAMAKSAGMSGDTIMQMSTDLAGLAADMASFYNLDFDTAFQKIRSGLSGETEPLKQLGINLSVANLEAYALSQGIEKVYKDMSQAEQMTLRYNYIMQATADAQGDFARTSDGYANGLRMLETNLEQFKTNVGAILLPAVSSVVGAINSIFDALSPDQLPETALDKFANIDLKTAEKIEEIDKTKQEALALVGVLDGISGKTQVADSMGSFVSILAGHFDDLDRALKKAKEGDFAGAISEVASALSTNLGGNSAQWQTLLTTIAEKVPSAVDAVSGDGSGNLAAFLTAASEAAASLGADYSGLWDSLLSVLADDAGAALSALKDGKVGAETMSAIAGSADDLKTDGSKWGSLFSNLTADLTKLTKSNGEEVGGFMDSVADGADKLKSDAGAHWKSLGDGLKTIPDKIKEVGDDIAGVADSANKLHSTAGGNWEGLGKGLDELPESVGVTGDELSGIADGANDLGSFAGDNWQSLETGIDGLPSSDDVDATVGDNLESLAEGANKLSMMAGDNWQSLESGIDGLPDSIAADAGTNLKSIAEGANALGLLASSNWTDLADALSSLPGVTEASADGAVAFIQSIAGEIQKLEPGDVAGFTALLDKLSAGLPEIFGTEEGQALIQQYKELAEAGVNAAGYGEIAEKSEEWAAALQKLVKLMPGLANLIDEQTGELKGGTDAAREYIEAWAEMQKVTTMRQAHAEKGAVLEQTESEIKTMTTQLQLATETYKVARDAYKQALEESGQILELDENGNLSLQYSDINWGDAELNRLKNLYVEAADAMDELTENVDRQSSALDEATAAYNQETEALNNLDANAASAAESVGLLTGALKEQAITAVDSLAENLQLVNDYYKDLKDNIASSVSQNIGVFSTDGVITAADKAKKEIQDLTAQITEANGKEINLKITGLEESIPTAQNMAKALEEQLAFMDRYNTALAEAKAHGVNEGILAQLSTGTTDDLDKLEALANGSQAEIDRINENYQKVIDAREEFVTNLTNTQLTGDETFQQMVASVNASLSDLETAVSGNGAANALGATMNEMVEAVTSRIPDLESAISTVAMLMDSLSNMSGGGYSYSSGSVGGAMSIINGSFATGLDYVPFDNFLAQLHEGESILTAEEAKVWRDFKTGGASTRNNIDYGALSGAIWDNAPKMGGGNVYLDGAAVGRVINAQQADSLRSLQRSGWQG